MTKKMKIWGLILIIVLILITAAVVVFIKKPTFFFPKAAADNVSGQVEITINITSPHTAEGKLVGQLSQDETGRVTGTVSDPSGEYARTITAQITVDEFVSDPTNVVFAVEDANGEMVDYEAEVVFEGAVVEEGNRISGKVTGNLIKPLSGPISGTFYSIRQLGAETDTPVPTNTSIPLPTDTPLPTATAVPPTNTPTNTSMPTNTPVPTNTAVPENTSTQVPTETSQPTSQPTNTQVPPTNTLIPTATLQPTSTIVLRPTSTPAVYSDSELPNTGGFFPTIILIILGGLFFLL